MPQAFHLRLRCFLEGIEVPIVSAAVSIQPNAPAQLQVQIPATDKSFNFLPRTLIHVFFYDYWEGASDLASIQVREQPQVDTVVDMLQRRAEELQEAEASERDPAMPWQQAVGSHATYQETDEGVLQNDGSTTAVGPTHSPQALNHDPAEPWRQAVGEHGEFRDLPTLSFADNPIHNDDNWKLFFAGEVIGYSFSKTATSRSILLDCLDNSVYWDTCYQYKVNVGSLTGDGRAAFVGAGTTFFDTFFQSTTSTIVEYVTHPSVTQPELTGLLSGVVRLLEQVGGVYVGNESQAINGANPRNLRNRFRGVNDFFSIAELRLKLVYQITAAEADESSRRLFARRAFAMWGNRSASRLGEIASFREILNVMMQFIYHSVYPNPMPRYMPPQDVLRRLTRTSVTDLRSTPQGRELISLVERIDRNVRAAQTALESHSETTDAGALFNNIASQCRNLKSRCLAMGHSGPAMNANNAADQANDVSRRWGPYSQRLLGSNAAVYGHNQDVVNRAVALIQSNMNAIRAYFSLTTLTRTNNVTRTVRTHGRLNSQIIRPDIFMVSPPRCNILFPEQTNNISFSRQFMREVTRMRLTVSDEIFGPDVLLDNFYYAPDVEVMGALPPRQLRGEQPIEGQTLERARYSKRLMDHELFTGVIPVFERMNEVNLYAARTDTPVYRGARIPYVTRAVNHQFFKHRWSSRQMQVSGRFNPYVVAGFPAVIVDRYMTKQQVVISALRGAEYLERSGGMAQLLSDLGPYGMTPDETGESAVEYEARNVDAWDVLREQVPTQFVGMVEDLQHSISQGSASTSMTLTYSRTHRDNEELLGANRQRVTQRSLQRETRSTRNPPQSEAPTTSETGEPLSLVKQVKAARARLSQSEETRTVGGPGERTVLASSVQEPRPAGQPAEGRAVRTTTVAAVDPPQVGQLGPYYGEITAVAPSQARGSFPLFGVYFGDRIRRNWRRYQIGVPYRAIDLGDEVVTQVGSRDAMVTLQAYDVTEAIDRWRGQPIDVPMEDFVRPPWMSDCWRNDRIGAVYQQFFGTGSITDPLAIQTGNAQQSVADADPADGVAAASAAAARRENATDPDRVEGRTTAGAGMILSVERAIDLLVRTYSLIRHAGLDVQEFVRAMTWRPIATLTDILGSQDLEMDANGNVTAGTEGFHSRAFGRGPTGQNLRNLVDEDVRYVLGFNEEEDRGNVMERMDKRAEKSDRVLAYVQELWDSRGLLG